MSTVSTASLEAEMKSAGLAAMEITWLRDLVSELGVRQGCVRVMEDNTGCVYLAHGMKDTAKSNHFKRSQAYVEDTVARGVMWLDDVAGAENPADIFTKSVEPSKQFEKLRDVTMGVMPELHLSRGVQEILGGVLGHEAGTNSLITNVRDWLAGSEASVLEDDVRL